jgi:hypothetical protein
MERKYEQKDLNIAYNDGLNQGRKLIVCCVDNCKITPMFCNKHSSDFIKKGLEKEKNKILKFIDELISEQDGLRKSNDLWRKSADELNEDFIDTLKKLKGFIE